MWAHRATGAAAPAARALGGHLPRPRRRGAAAYFKVWLPGQEGSTGSTWNRRGGRRQGDRRQRGAARAEGQNRVRLAGRAPPGGRRCRGCRRASAPAAQLPAGSLGPSSAAHPHGWCGREDRPDHAEWMEQATSAEPISGARPWRPTRPWPSARAARPSSPGGGPSWNWGTGTARWPRALGSIRAVQWRSSGRRGAAPGRHRAEAVRAYSRYLQLAPDGAEASAARGALAALQAE